MKRIIVGTVLSMVFGMSAYAANLDNPVEGKLKAIYTDYITITIPSLVSKAPEVNTSSLGDLDIKINSSTAFDNFNRLSDLKQGDRLSVTYDENNPGNNKVADRIRRTKLASDSDVSSSSTTQTTVTTTTVTNSETNPVINE